MEFVAVDVETANADMSTICSIGIVQFKDGRVAKNLSTLIDPECEFDPINISIHGIEPEHVMGKPTMRDLYPVLHSHFANVIVVHHTHFDRTALRQVAATLGLPELTCRWADSAKMARRTWERFSKRGYGLSSLAAEFKIEFEHHRADEDARCAGLIAVRAIAETGIPIERWCELLEERASAARHLINPIFKANTRIEIDGNPDGPLYGEVVAFTGELSMERSQAAQLAAVAGCEVCGGVTKRTTILVVGDIDARVLKGHEKSSKHRKAEALIENGQQLRIVRETDFREMLRL